MSGGGAKGERGLRREGRGVHAIRYILLLTVAADRVGVCVRDRFVAPCPLTFLPLSNLSIASQEYAAVVSKTRDFVKVLLCCVFLAGGQVAVG